MNEISNREIIGVLVDLLNEIHAQKERSGKLVRIGVADVHRAESLIRRLEIVERTVLRERIARESQKGLI